MATEVKESAEAKEDGGKKLAALLLNKSALKAVLPAVSKERSRYTPDGIRLTEDFIEATDGHKAIRVTTPSIKGGFPSVRGFVPSGFTECLLPRSTAQELVDALSDTDRYAIPILGCAAISSDGDGAITAVVTDLDTTHILTPKAMRGKFPDIQAVLDMVKVNFSVALNPTFLREIAQAAEDLNADSIKIDFDEPTKAVRFEAKREGQTMTALLMPMRV